MTVITQSPPKVKVTPVYAANWKALNLSDKRYIVNEGGSRSGKTYSIVQVLISYAIKNKGTKITIVSRSLPHLKSGAMRDFLEIMDVWGYYKESNHNKTDHIYNFPNKSYIEFVGLEDPDKARGPGRDLLYINEANMISKPLFDQLDMRTRYKSIIDLNPSDFDVWCYDIADGNNAVTIHSTYLNNISNLPKPQIEVIESYHDADPLMWQVFGLGLRGTSQEQIYTHWKVTDEIPAKGSVCYGLDFGYNVPSALVKIETYEGANYAEEIIYQTKLTTGDLIEKMKSIGINRSDVIYCDAAEPKTIEELIRAGFNAKPAHKDVTEGIRKVKSMPLYITRNSENLIKELKTYKWKTDKNGKVLDEPVKENDHISDALRYAIFTSQGQFKFKILVG
jgi:phage terminase large subunit